MDSTEKRKVFDEKEIRTLLKRATELQQRTVGVDAGATGLTLEEVEQIAADLGIDPSFVRQAAGEKTATSATSRFALGLPRTRIVERTVAGALTDERWRAAVEEARRAFGGVGRTSQLGDTREWCNSAETSSVSVAPEADGARIRVAYRYDLANGLGLFLATSFSLFGSLAFVSETLHWAPLAEAGVVVGTVTTVVTLARSALALGIRRHGRKLRRLAQRLETVFQQKRTEGAETLRETQHGSDVFLAQPETEQQRDNEEVAPRRLRVR